MPLQLPGTKAEMQQQIIEMIAKQDKMEFLKTTNATPPLPNPPLNLPPEELQRLDDLKSLYNCKTKNCAEMKLIYPNAVATAPATTKAPVTAVSESPTPAGTLDVIAAYNKKFKKSDGSYEPNHSAPTKDGNKVSMSFASLEEAKNFFKELAKNNPSQKFLVRDASTQEILYHYNGDGKELQSGPPIPPEEHASAAP